ncbi:MAG: tRNA (guanosine(37)-N1)-methyltransferase TrmD [Anaerolineae bacterium]
MRFDIFTLFPAMFDGPFGDSIIKRAVEAGQLEIHVHNIRDWAEGRHRITDDYPYGGGGGMVMKPEPIFAAVEAVLGPDAADAASGPLILMDPQGALFTQQTAERLAALPRVSLLCGHYEGVDERVREHLVTEEMSIGDYVLTGGELPAMVVVDAVARLLPGVLGNPVGAIQDSIASGLLEGPQYTRPVEYRGWRVPDILLSGHHAEVARWRRREALRRTWERRSDLIETASLSDADRRYLEELEKAP